jgi:hypothetical protein
MLEAYLKLTKNKGEWDSAEAVHRTKPTEGFNPDPTLATKH